MPKNEIIPILLATPGDGAIWRVENLQMINPS
jgi:hypothetical protein